MRMDKFDLHRVREYLLANPDCSVIIIANNRTISEEYWKRIQGHVGVRKRPYIVTNAKSWDALPIMSSLVLKIGRWWENRNAIEFLETHTRMAKMVLPITFIPPFVKGGESEK